MLQKLYNKIECYYPVYDKKQLTYIISVILFIFANMLLQLFFSIYFYILNVPEIYIINNLHIAIFIFILYLIIFKYKLKFSCSLLIVTLCCYTIYTTYILGYEKGNIVFFPVIIFAMYNIFPLNKIYLNKISLFVILAFLSTLFINISDNSKYNNHFMNIQYINLFLACVFLVFIVGVEFFADKFINKFSTKDLQKVSTDSHQDYLTGLWNRRFLELEFNQFDNNDNSIVVIADIDYFKNINDSFGHNTGDYVLKKVADIFRSNLCETNIICRWGGEEFIFYFKNANYDDIISKLEKIKNKIETTIFKYGDQSFYITTSFGVTTINSDISFLDNVGNADQALYFCKNNGRNMIATYSDDNNHQCSCSKILDTNL